MLSDLAPALQTTLLMIPQAIQSAGFLVTNSRTCKPDSDIPGYGLLWNTTDLDCSAYPTVRLIDYPDEIRWGLSCIYEIDRGTLDLDRAQELFTLFSHSMRYRPTSVFEYINHTYTKMHTYNGGQKYVKDDIPLICEYTPVSSSCNVDILGFALIRMLLEAAPGKIVVLVTCNSNSGRLTVTLYSEAEEPLFSFIGGHIALRVKLLEHDTSLAAPPHVGLSSLTLRNCATQRLAMPNSIATPDMCTNNIKIEGIYEYQYKTEQETWNSTDNPFVSVLWRGEERDCPVRELWRQACQIAWPR